MRKEIIIGVTVLIIYAVIDKTILADKADVIYTLSQEIPSNFIETGKKEIIQQLLIRNNGKEEASKIIIRISRQINDFKIVKYASSDSIKLKRTRNNFEIEYPSLPTQGEIKILLKSEESGIEKSQVEVRHNKGRAKEAFEQSSTISVSLIIFGLYFLAFFINSLIGIATNSYETDVKYNPIENILKKKKPFYISHNKWSSFRVDALKNYFANDFATKITDTLAYRTLQIEKPNYLNEEEWSSLLIKAFENLKSKVSETANYSYGFSEGGSVLNLEKPKQVHEDKWQEIRKIISNFYFFHEVQKIKDGVWLRRIEDELDLVENRNLTEANKRSLKAIFSLNYFGRILEGLHKYDKPNELREKINFRVLNDEQKKVIDKVINLLEFFIMEKQTYELLISKTKQASKGLLTIESGDKIEKEDLDELVELNRSIEEILGQKDQLSKDRTDLSSKVLTVTRQLELIDRILIDPSYIDKIEDLDNPFKPGNFRNLTILASVLKSIKLN